MQTVLKSGNKVLILVLMEDTLRDADIYEFVHFKS